MKLRSKIHLYSSVLFALLLVLMSLTIYYLFSRMSLNSQLEQTRAAGAKIAAEMKKAAGNVPESDMLRAYVPAAGMIRLLGQDGSGPAAVTSASEQELSRVAGVYSASSRSEVTKLAGGTYAFVSIPVVWHDGKVMNVQVTENLDSTLNMLRVLRLVLAAVTLLVLLPLLISSRILAGLIMRPIVEMTLTMQDIKQSGKFRRLELDGRSKDELVEMGRTFNEMITLLESNYAKQEKFVSDASHELRTPLTVIESYASLLKRRGLDHPEVFLESVEAIESEAIRMKELTEQLLLLAGPKEQWNLDMAVINLAEVAENSAKAFRNAYGREVRVHSDRAIKGYSDEAKLRQLMFIFLDNARKYSDEDIIIRLETSGRESCIRITDRGIGISKTELPRIFDRFYRVDEARVREDGGAGLGLSLAAEISKAIGARIELESLEGTGTTVKIWIPSESREKR
ncbi:HAMP domain-containing histidine kinase [Paenibacillus albidus]|uniref:sensor histidine kinase n=1 Tax=Paenibacillus albidus TaxID=2041023 RepID=UPI001BEA9761|nr:HAMP domain-containing sensor histidine kinase [Paenibacillus albidus]MBT2287800.1 HAMP domain-containing histidine kinase [Paenibacillus albidus]